MSRPRRWGFTRIGSSKGKVRARERERERESQIFHPANITPSTPDVIRPPTAALSDLILECGVDILTLVHTSETSNFCQETPGTNERETKPKVVRSGT